MGKVISLINRQINRFNVENRAHRILEKDKPTPAPKHPSTLKHIEQIVSETPNVKEELLLKNKQLDENLKKVYVTSQDYPAPDLRKPSDRARLPTSKTVPKESEFGYQEPDTIPQGRITLKQAMQILARHQEDSQKYSKAQISNEFKISVEDTSNLLKYFTVFKTYIPQKETENKQDVFKRFLYSSTRRKDKLKGGGTDVKKINDN